MQSTRPALVVDLLVTLGALVAVLVTIELVLKAWGSALVRRWRAGVRRWWTGKMDALDSFQLVLLLIGALGYGPLLAAAGAGRRVRHESGVWSAWWVSAFVFVVGVRMVVLPRPRTVAFLQLQRLRWGAPMLMAFGFSLASLNFFAATLLLSDNRFVEGAASGMSGRQVAEFLLWHWCDALPLADVTSTLRWREPLRYRGSDIGAIVLISKVTVAVPTVALFAQYARFLKAEEPLRRGAAAGSDEGSNNELSHPSGRHLEEQ